MDDFDAAEWDEFSDGRRGDEIRRIIRYQRWLIGLILMELVAWVLVFLVRGSGPELMLVAFTLAAAAFVFMLETTLNGWVAGFLGGAMSLIPGLGVLVQVAVNRGATASLTKYGLKVGLFGASVTDLKPVWTPYDIDPETGW